MAEVRSTQRLPVGSPLPDFLLPDAGGTLHRFSDRPTGAAVVVFACNHCPYVVHIAPALAAMAAEFAGKAAFFAINSNDTERYPDDAPDKMPGFALAHGWTFPYLVDSSQETARTYGAACTPDFFVADPAGNLFYRGQFDNSRPPRPGRPNAHPIDGRDLRAALLAALVGAPPPRIQAPASGCNIKWKSGNEPEWFAGR